MEETKQCSVKSGCGEVKLLSEFHKQASSKDGHKSVCKACKAAKDKLRTVKPLTTAQRERKREYKKNWDLQNKKVVHTCKEPPHPSVPHIEKIYGLTEEGYRSLLNSQNNSCAICNMSEQEFVSTYRGKRTLTKLFVDHDHITGRVRGLLCDKCNRGIGLLRDTAESVLAAYKYLS